ncbi:MAG TPA: long-chain-fatty-acid--CoA ligase [Bryobacteraceae bacterium]|nr:long-chain-fatty-acid--CoA ligase [Bryobacteraceae bacterium]
MFIPLTPLRCLHRAIDVFGSKIGVVSGDLQFTYAQFGERAERLAHGLESLGIEAGDRIAFLSFNNHQLLEGYYGVPQARGIVMPLNVRLSEAELAAILNHAGAKMLIFESDFAPLAALLRKTCPGVKDWIGIGHKLPPADLEYEEILDQGRPGRADIFSYDEMAIAELFYTSGSTGTPKGVALAHRTLYLHAMAVALEYGNPETMVELHTIPLFHANGWGRPQAATMLGTKQVMVRRFDPATVFRLTQEHRATDMCVVPTMAQALLNAPGRNQWDTSSLRRIMIGGAASSPDLVRRMEEAFPGCQCIAGYGLTETSPVVTTSLWKGIPYASEGERIERQAMTGWPIPGTAVRVVDENMRDVPRDGKTIGEIVVLGDQVMDGYFEDPEATAAVMSPEGWFHTGDMAVWDSECYLNIVDRKKEIIISGGENISSIEIEKAIDSHPAVAECAVVAAPDEKWGEIPVAIVARKPGSRLTEADLLEFLKQKLSRFKLPRSVEFHDPPLPKTGTGKIRKLQLREKFWVGREKRVQG